MLFVCDEFMIKIWLFFCMVEWWTELSGSYWTKRWTHITSFWRQ